MTIYEVTGIGLGGTRPLGKAAALLLGALALALLTVSCESPSGREERTPDRQETTERDRPTRTGPESKENEQAEQEIWQLFVNGWVLERLLTEDRPVALIAVPEASSLEEGLAGALRRRGVSAHGGVFTAEAYQSGELLCRLAGGDDIVLRDLRLGQLSGHLVLGRLSFSNLRALREGFRTRAYLSVTLVPLSGGQPAERTFEARGSGFEAAEARAQATRRVQNDFLRSALADRLARR